MYRRTCFFIVLWCIRAKFHGPSLSPLLHTPKYSLSLSQNNFKILSKEMAYILLNDIADTFNYDTLHGQIIRRWLSTCGNHQISCLSTSQEEALIWSVTLLVRALHSCWEIAPGFLRQWRGKYQGIKSTVMNKKYGFETKEFSNIIAVNDFSLSRSILTHDFIIPLMTHTPVLILSFNMQLVSYK